ncbi:alpha/beta fold hydrolase [Pseudonocardia halophobica]|uniref:alpha/beta fold hydrolase n=1 Tax=Pseudonocardia halophobica TaxID=29401 RepID=UPI0034DAE094
MPDSPLHVHLAGDPAGAPVLALHGVTGHGLRFRPVTEALPALRWLGVDLRGHGRSPWAPPWNLEQHVADALGVLDAHGVERAAVVGHSFGGAVATHLARTRPNASRSWCCSTRRSAWTRRTCSRRRRSPGATSPTPTGRRRARPRRRAGPGCRRRWSTPRSKPTSRSGTGPGGGATRARRWSRRGARWRARPWCRRRAIRR